MTGPQPVGGYLDRLFDALAGTGPAGRRVLAEAEDHLREATAAGVAEGLTERVAQERAIARFGRPEEVAAALAAQAGRWSLRQLAGAALVVAVVGLVVAVVGLVAAADLAGGGLRLIGTGPSHGAGGDLADGAMAALAALGFAVVLWRQPGRATSPVR